MAAPIRIDQATKPAREARKLFTRADQLKVRALPMLISGVLAEASFAFLVGASGSCKSFLALAWAFCVATGTPWFGRPVKQGAVFWLAGEGLTGIRKRLAGIEAWLGVSLEGAPMYVSAGMPCLCEQSNAARIVAEVQEIADALFFDSGGIEPELIVIDTLARAMVGYNESATDDAGAFVQTGDWFKDEWGAAVLVLHHTGLDPSAQDRGRGSGSFKGAADFEFLLKANGKTDLTLRFSKVKEGPCWPEVPDLALARCEVEVMVDIPPAEIVPDGPTQRRDTTLVLIDRPGVQMQEDLKNRALDLHIEGLTIRKIAGLLGVSKSAVDRWLKSAQTPADVVPSHGVSNTPVGGTPNVPRDRDSGRRRDSGTRRDGRAAAAGAYPEASDGR